MSRVQDCLPLHSSVRQRFGEVTWSRTPIGDEPTWPCSLRCMVQAMLCSPVAMVVAWGPELTMLYNDAYANLLGRRHPAALGQPYADVWPEVWEAVWPDVKRTLEGHSVSYNDAPFVVQRNGAPEQTWWDFALSPLRDEAGIVQGMLAVFNETTSKVMASQHRQDQLMEFVRLFEQAPNFMAVLHGPQHVYRSANRAYLELVGRTSIVGQPLRSALPELEAQGIADLLDDVYASGRPHEARRVQAMLRDSGGSNRRVVVDVVLQPLRDARGQVEGILVVGTDVTDLARTEQELRDSEAMFRTLSNSMPQLAWCAGSDGSDDFHNDRWYDFVGAVPGELLGHGWRKYVHPDDQQRVRAEWDHVVGTDTCYEVEYRLKHASGAWRWVIARGLPVADGHGPAQRWVGTVTDVHEIKSMELALRDAKHRLEATLAAAEMGTWVWHVAANSVRADPHMARLHNLRADQAADTPIESFCGQVHPEDVAGVQQRFERTIATGEPFEATYRVPRPDGGVRYIYNRGKVVQEDGALWLPGVAVDVTAQKLAEEDLAALNRRKDRFLAVLAHELRNPLAPISNIAGVLTREPAPAPAQVRTLGDMLKRQTEQLVGLVDDLLDIARINTGKVVLTTTPCPLADVLAQALEQVSSLAEAKGLQLSFETRETPTVLGDHKRLVQVFANLLVNAVRYTPDGGAVVVRMTTRARHAVVRVEDSGIGLTPEEINRVFELFEQGDERTGDQQGGLGLGLALVRSLVHLHGGTVQLTSAGRNRGCTAETALPLMEGAPLALPRRQLRA